MKLNNKSWARDILRFYFYNNFSKQTEEDVQKFIVNNYDNNDIEYASREYWNSIKLAGKTNSLNLDRIRKKVYFEENISYKYLVIKVARIASIIILLLGIGVLAFNYFSRSNTNTITTAFGETRYVILPDSTCVWLNAGSILKYPSVFTDNKRSVSLTGEAFFSVKHDENKPFIVNTSHLSVKDLGTRFNLRSYKEESRIVATLEEGKIEVNTIDRQNRQLNPNEQLEFDNKTDAIKIFKISSNDIPDWQNGNLIFYKCSMYEILNSLKRNFNIDLKIDRGIDLNKELYTIKFSKKESVQDIFSVLSDLAGDFTFSMADNKEIVLKNK